MEGQYNPHQIESKWTARWHDNSVFKPELPTGEELDESYCIMIPPPNVTGTLHMGHAFQHTLIDILVRHHRMTGKPTLWQMGTDHAGIATQMLVARKLQAEGKDPVQMGREAFLEEVDNWVDHSGKTIANQIARMGSSVDWTNTRFTMDEHYHQTVLQVFVRLYREGLIYRGKKLVNWDPLLQTAISDLEVINKEEKGKLYTVSYQLVDGSGSVDIATTRPETILADGAVAISPGDPRYTHLPGKEVWVPMTDRKIPVIEDEYVEPEFGTGCVKITPAHDFNDYKVGQRHTMEVINLFTPEAKMNENAPESYQGMDRFEAREKIVADLENAGLLKKVEDHIYKRPYGDRSGVVIEPYFTDQWFVETKDLAKRARDVVAEGKINFIPEQWTKVYYNWMDNIEDWCISRQLWWGHRIPAWYDKEGNYYIGLNEQEVREKYRLGKEIHLQQDEDVLDTWFSSALWTFATLGWPEKTKALQTFHPTSVLVTGFDIIFFWVARMIMFTLHFTDEVPFNQVYVHGLVRDGEGQKMSKSKGNILDPLNLVDGIELEELVQGRTSNMMQPELAKKIETQTRKQFPDGIDSYGADALRLTFCSLASTGRDIRFDIGRLEGYRNFCNKLWNATRYVLMQVDDYNPHEDYSYGVAETWLISTLQKCEEDVSRAIETYRFDLLCNHLYNFVWHNYCDWYVELSKQLLASAETANHRRGVQRALLQTLDACLRMLHPVIPFITEELWEQIKTHVELGDQQSLSLQKYPVADTTKIDQQAEQAFSLIMRLIQSLRSLRGSYNISPKAALKIIVLQPNKEFGELIKDNRELIQSLANLQAITIAEQQPEEPALLCQVQGTKILTLMEGAIDPQQELQRLEKEQQKIATEIERLEKKLSSQFAQKAPEEIVAQEKQKLESLRKNLETIDEQLQYLAGVTS